MKEQPTHYLKASNFIRGCVCIIIVLVPFHAFFTTWAGSNFGHLLVWRAWKELLLVLPVIVAAWLLLKDAELRSHFFKHRLNQVMLIYIVWELCTAALHSRELAPLALGLTIQLRIIVVFLLGQIAVYYKKPTVEFLETLVLIPALGVVVFGLLQITAFPFDFLKHFGYQKNRTIPPYFTIDEQLTHLRYASTLRGPNPLGVYILLPLTTVFANIWQRKKILLYGTALLANLVVLYVSQSRGAWIGAAAALGVYILFKLPSKLRLVFILVATLFLMLAGGVVYIQRGSSFVENIVLHNNPDTGGEVDSNAGHASSLKIAIRDIGQHPLTGCGPGCAGPASEHSKNAPKLAENYFLQTAQESGIIGLLLLLAICILIAYYLYQQTNPLASVLLASFAGICVASLFAHAWADDTIAYVWWGLAGLVITNQTHSDSSTANAKHQRIYRPTSS